MQALDRAVYPQGSQVHATVSDIWLNIDPTDEDSWTFGTVEDAVESSALDVATTNYQVFNENGIAVGDVTENTDTNLLTAALGNLMCEDNCIMEFNPDVQDKGNVATIQDNEDSAIILNIRDDAQDPLSWSTAAGFLNSTVPITITESGPNSGVFGTYDESDTSVVKITDDAARGTSASITYNEDSYSILVGFDFATIDIQPVDDEWNSGEEIPLIIVDGDANKNSRADEDLDLNEASVSLIPSLQTGDPFTLGEAGLDTYQIMTGNATADVTAGSLGAAVGDVGDFIFAGTGAGNGTGTISVESFSERAILPGVVCSNGASCSTPQTGVEYIIIDLEQTMEDLKDTITVGDANFHGFNFFNYDVRTFGATQGTVDIYLINSTDAIINDSGFVDNISTNDVITLVINGDNQGLVSLTTVSSTLASGDGSNADDTQNIGLLFAFDDAEVTLDENAADAFVADFFSFGFNNDGRVASERVANQIIRIEAEESGDNTSSFEGSLEYIMMNQLNVNDEATYLGLSTIADDPSFIVIEDLTDEDSPRVNYLDLGSDGVSTQIADQEEAPSHSGIVSFDADSYKDADTVTITLEDLDLNVDSDLIDIYTTVLTVGDANIDVVGDETTVNGGTSFALSNGDQLGRLLDITFDDAIWTSDHAGCTPSGGADDGLGATGFTLVETDISSGQFIGDFQIPASFCRADLSSPATGESVTGLDIEVNYVDFRDASGEIIEVGDSAGVRANTGSVSLDRTVYPVPFGVPDNYGVNTESTPQDGTTERSLFPIHQTGVDGTGIADVDAGLTTGEFLAEGDLTIHVRVNDPDFDISAAGEDSIAQNTAAGVGPVKISVIRGSDSVTLGYAGGDAAADGTIDVDDADASVTRQFGPIAEIAPDAGIFEADIVVRYTDGPASQTCPDTTVFESIDGGAAADGSELSRFAITAATGEYCILQGDILQVEYTDPADASGDVNTVTDSATFDLRNGVLQSDKSVYIIGSDMILTLIEPDFDLDNDQAETYDLDLIEWDSDAATISMGDADGEGAAFDPEPLNFRETGDSTGIFQIVIEIPEELDGDRLERGEESILEYTDWGPSGSDYVGDEDEDVNLTIYTSNFGATVELDQKVYTWTDKVYITIVAPDHNFDSDLVDEIGNTDDGPNKGLNQRMTISTTIS